jgi:hypothetical protein
MALEAAQELLLTEMVQAARRVPRAEQRWHLSERDQNDVLSGAWGVREVLGPRCVRAPSRRAAAAGRGHHGAGSDWVISADGYKYYARIKQRAGEPLERQEAEVRPLLA